MRRALNSRGFSLIELAIAMAISGVMIASMLASYQIYAKQQAPNETRSRKEVIRIAMERYLTTFSKLPCPADPSLPLDDPNAGVSASPCPPVGLAVGACIGGICLASGFEDSDLNGVMDPVVIGGLPYVTLGISYKEAFDGWHGSMGYAVSHRQTVAYGNNLGVIDLKVYNATLGEVSALKNGQPANIDLVVWAAGENGAGAYNTNGKMPAACLVGAKETENCDGDAVFMNYDKQRSLVTGSADYYDDYIILDDVSVKSDRWAQSAMTDIFNSANGNIGIGTPAPAERLHVEGNVMADKTSSNFYCDESGANCFPAQIIGGAGINCGAGALTGIKGAAASCFNKVDTSSIVPSTCPVGEYVVAIDPSARLVCCSPGEHYIGVNGSGFGKCCPLGTALSGFDGAGEPICM